jgi:hypothetical protein
MSERINEWAEGEEKKMREELLAEVVDMVRSS